MKPDLIKATTIAIFLLNPSLPYIIVVDDLVKQVWLLQEKAGSFK